jgi:flagellar hook-associated protein 1 FlgK
MSLFSSLSSTAGALGAQEYGLEIAGQNLANINTPGYARRTVNLAEAPGTDPLIAGGGVEVQSVTAQRNALVESRLWHEQPSGSEQAAIADSLSVVQTALGGASLDTQLNNFFDAFSALANDPTSRPARFQVVSKGQSLAQTFNAVSASLATSQRDADANVRTGVDQVNALAATLASINTSLAGTTDAGAETLKDQQSNALQSLSQLIDFSVIHHADGSVDVSIGQGRALVAGANSYQLRAVSGGPQGFASIFSGSADVSAEIGGGSIGGALRVRDVVVPGYAASLDKLAFDLSTSVNAAHQAGFDLNGNPGGAFFTPLAAPAGAAAALSVNPAIVNDGTLIAAASAPVAGDNRTAAAIGNLRTTVLAGGATPLDAWGAIVYRVGSDVQAARQEQSSRADVITQLQNLRDQTSGVSMDEEAASMIRFQRAYEANARFFTTLSDSLDTLLAMVNR